MYLANMQLNDGYLTRSFWLQVRYLFIYALGELLSLLDYENCQKESGNWGRVTPFEEHKYIL